MSTPKVVKISARELVAQAKLHYPTSKHLRKQWIRKTVTLVDAGRHVLYGGKITWGETVDAKTGAHQTILTADRPDYTPGAYES